MKNLLVSALFLAQVLIFAEELRINEEGFVEKYQEVFSKNNTIMPLKFFPDYDIYMAFEIYDAARVLLKLVDDVEAGRCSDIVDVDQYRESHEGIYVKSFYAVLVDKPVWEVAKLLLAPVYQKLCRVVEVKCKNYNNINAAVNKLLEVAKECPVLDDFATAK